MKQKSQGNPHRGHEHVPQDRHAASQARCGFRHAQPEEWVRHDEKPAPTRPRRDASGPAPVRIAPYGRMPASATVSAVALQVGGAPDAGPLAGVPAVVPVPERRLPLPCPVARHLHAVVRRRRRAVVLRSGRRGADRADDRARGQRHRRRPQGRGPLHPVDHVQTFPYEPGLTPRHRPDRSAGHALILTLRPGQIAAEHCLSGNADLFLIWLK